jgi:SNARE protein 1
MNRRLLFGIQRLTLEPPQPESLLAKLPLPDSKPVIPETSQPQSVVDNGDHEPLPEGPSDAIVDDKPTQAAEELLLSSPTEAYIPFQSTPLPQIPRRRTSEANPTVTDALSSTFETQEELSAQLADMAKQLKANAMHFAGSLEKDKAVLEAADQQLEKNFDKMSQTRTQVQGIRTKSRGTTWLVLASIVGVIAAFIAMVLLMRIT